MKKTLSFLLILCMALAVVLKPSAAFATTNTSTVVYNGITFTDDLVIDAASQDVSITNCTFSTNNAEYLYACTIKNAGKVTLTGNKINNSLRGFNVDGTALTATGNSITLTPITDPLKAEKNVGIQMYNKRWDPAQINISYNRIENATTGIRLHSTFGIATGTAKSIVIEHNSMVNVLNYVGIDPASGSSDNGDPDNAQTLKAILPQITIKDQSVSSKISANSDVSYTVVIPTAVDFGKLYHNMDTQIEPFNVTVNNAFLEKDAKITVAAQNLNGTTGTMFGTNGATLPFHMDYATFIFSQADLLNAGGNKTIANRIWCNPTELTAAGSYLGLMTFDVSYAK